MKKIFMSTILALTLLLSESPAYATPVQIYDPDFSNMLNSFKGTCRLFNIDVWGTEYYTYKGARRCEVHFGDSENNLIRFRLNDDNSVSRILITFPPQYIIYNDTELLLVLAGILNEIGLSTSELEILSNDLSDKMDRMGQYATHFHDKSSVWCAKTRRYITLDFECDYSKVDFYLYASI